MKVILDCNIWISFLLGKQHGLLKKVLTDMRFDVYVCRELLQEIADVACRDKIRKRVSEEELRQLFKIIDAYCYYEEISTKVVTGVRDPKDLYLLSFAQEITADYIVSGDKDLTDLECYQQTKILKLTEFKDTFSFS